MKKTSLSVNSILRLIVPIVAVVHVGSHSTSGEFPKDRLNAWVAYLKRVPMKMGRMQEVGGPNRAFFASKSGYMITGAIIQAEPILRASVGPFRWFRIRSILKFLKRSQHVLAENR
jgi:hypothetical protein